MKSQKTITLVSLLIITLFPLTPLAGGVADCSLSFSPGTETMILAGGPMFDKWFSATRNEMPATIVAGRRVRIPKRDRRATINAEQNTRSVFKMLCMDHSQKLVGLYAPHDA